jgi:hypothetical protein
MKLSVARAIHRQAQKTPVISVGKVTTTQFGSDAEFAILGDNMGYHLSGNKEGTKWWLAHFVYGGSYAEGATPKEAAVAFAKRLKWLPEEIKRRKLAAKIVGIYGPGPEVTEEGPTWVARLDGEIVAKAENYCAAMKMAERVEAQRRKEAETE